MKHVGQHFDLTGKNILIQSIQPALNQIRKRLKNMLSNQFIGSFPTVGFEPVVPTPDDEPVIGDKTPGPADAFNQKRIASSRGVVG